LDEVRRLTNFSTGRLGAELASHLASTGHSVVLLRGEMATWPAPANPVIRVEPFTTSADLQRRLEALAGADPRAVFHAAAVSDFTFGRVFQRTPDGRGVPLHAGKFSTRDGRLFAELTPTPKIIARLREWFPRAWLIGWKYAVDGGREAALREAAEQLASCSTDACVANGPAYGEGFGVVHADASPTQHCPDRQGLLACLTALVAGPRG
jgi:phosphopantothenoylcysteine synthetase/decarboxylase